MSTQWVSRKQAAAGMGCSVRTMQRWINSGKVPSRLSDGRREVLLTPAESAEAAEAQAQRAAAQQASERVAELQRQLSVVEADRDAAERVATLAQRELRRAWRLGAWAGAWAAALIVGVLVGSVFSAVRVTRATGTADHLAADLVEATDRLQEAHDRLAQANAQAAESAQVRSELAQTQEMLQMAQRARAEAIAELAERDLRQGATEPVRAARAQR